MTTGYEGGWFGGRRRTNRRILKRVVHCPEEAINRIARARAREAERGAMGGERVRRERGESEREREK